MTCSFGMIYIYTPELYPTSIRSITMGICNTAARSGSALAPFAADLVSVVLDYVVKLEISKYSRKIPFVISFGHCH